MQKRKHIEKIWKEINGQPNNVELVGSDKEWEFWEKLLDSPPTAPYIESVGDGTHVEEGSHE